MVSSDSSLRFDSLRLADQLLPLLWWRPATEEIDAYEQYGEKVRTPDYPCFFGQGAEVRGEMLYCFSNKGSHDDLAVNLTTFVNLIAAAPYELSGLAAFFEPDPAISRHASSLRNSGNAASPSRTRSPPGYHPVARWSSPLSSARCLSRARRQLTGTGGAEISAGHGPSLQPRFLFIDPATSEPIAVSVRQRLHKRMLAYDGLPVHPDIGSHGQPTNREWKQYALPDDNEPSRQA